MYKIHPSKVYAVRLILKGTHVTDIPLWKQIACERDLRRIILHRVAELIDRPAELRTLVDRLILESKQRQDDLETAYFQVDMHRPENRP